MLSTPPRFEPTEQFIDRLYLYRIDRERNICKVTILSDQATRPAGYYAVVGAPVIESPPDVPHPDQVELTVETKPEKQNKSESKPVSPKSTPEKRRRLRLVPRFSFYRLKKQKIKTSSDRRFTKRPHFRVRRSMIALASVVATAAAFLIVYPLYPAIQYNVGQSLGTAQRASQALAASPVTDSNELLIPKIGVKSAILEGDSLDILNKKEGVWHQAGTLGVDNFVLAGHRWKYLPPNISTFYNLDKLSEGDSIIIDWYQKRYVFTVLQVLTVAQDRTDLIQPTTQPRLTLYTCNDHAETQRIVAIAALVP
jgi:LPXTG-site transpeptidase (sortase) family protein